jgi:hypothetical protein
MAIPRLMLTTMLASTLARAAPSLARSSNVTVTLGGKLRQGGT